MSADIELPWQRLHALSLVANLAPRTWRTLRSSWPLFAAFIVGGRRDSAFILFLVGLFFALAVWNTVIHFVTLRYRMTEGRLQIRSGLLNRQVRSLDPARIQNTELVRNLLHKALGLVELRVETASGHEVEGLLSGLSEAQGDELMAALQTARRVAGPAEPDTSDDTTTLAHADVGDLLRYGATGLRLGAGIAVAVGLGVEALQLLDPQQYEAVPSMFAGSTGIALLVAFISGLFLLAVAGSVQRFYGFELTLGAGRLVATQGLFTKRRVELRVDKVQLATVQQPLFRRALRFATLHIETAAAHIGDGGTASAEAVVPVVDNDDIAALLEPVVHGAASLWNEPLLAPHPRALRRSLISAVVEGVVIGALLGWWFGGLGWALVLVVALLNAGMAVLDHRHQGWRVTESVVVSRRGFINRRTELLSRSKIQSMSVQQGPILRRWGLARLVVRVAGSRVHLPLLAATDAEALMDQLRPARPAPVAAAPAPPAPPL